MKTVRDHEEGRKIEAAPPPRGEEERGRADTDRGKWR